MPWISSLIAAAASPSRNSIPRRLLSHARKQAHQRNFDDVIIVDVDAHHYEGENCDEFMPYMENDVLRQLTMSSRAKGGRAGVAWCRASAIRTWAAG